MVLTYDGQPTAGIDDLHRLLTEARLGVSSPMTLLRGIEVVTLHVVPEESNPAGRGSEVRSRESE